MKRNETCSTSRFWAWPVAIDEKWKLVQVRRLTFSHISCMAVIVLFRVILFCFSPYQSFGWCKAIISTTVLTGLFHLPLFFCVVVVVVFLVCFFFCCCFCLLFWFCVGFFFWQRDSLSGLCTGPLSARPALFNANMLHANIACGSTWRKRRSDW